MDPPRREVESAIEVCREAGIRIIMLTGDQPVTARHIGLALGLIDEDESQVIHGKELKDPEELSENARKRLLRAAIFARVNPKQKLDLITLHQTNGSVVAMTGDGVNDAPALKKADIGVAMGERGTQVAKEAADMVLRDDAFRTIAVAIEQGRAIFDNIRKFILFLLSGNVGEIMIVAFALLGGAPLPILPLQILYLNMIGDVFPALALGVGKGDPSKMKRPPRDPKEPLLTNRHWFAIGGYGLLIAFSVLTAFTLALTWLQLETKSAVTVSFLTLAFARLWHVFNMRDQGSAFLRNDITRNPFVWGALLLCVGLLLAAVFLPGLSLVLSMVRPSIEGWGLIISMSLIPWVIGQALKSRGPDQDSNP
jgi:Ca2+-transporting ATPase